jgi:acyl carrier protein
MMDVDAARAIVYDAIDAVNQQLPAAKRLRKSPDTNIIGPGSALDSLAIINLVVAVEEKVADRTGVAVQLLDADMIGGDSPFRTVDSLARHIAAQSGTRP